MRSLSQENLIEELNCGLPRNFGTFLLIQTLSVISQLCIHESLDQLVVNMCVTDVQKTLQYNTKG